jgi:hypothetical protein
MASQENLTYTMPLEVYLQSAVVRGILVTNQDRLSNYLTLSTGDEVFSLRDATLENLERKTIVAGSDQYLIYMQEVFLIADLSSQARLDRPGLENLYVKKDTTRALLSVGPYWLQGDLHIVPGGALHEVLMAKTRFIPVTGAALLNRPDLGPRAYLVNRAKVGFMTASGDFLVEL